MEKSCKVIGLGKRMLHLGSLDVQPFDDYPPCLRHSVFYAAFLPRHEPRGYKIVCAHGTFPFVRQVQAWVLSTINHIYLDSSTALNRMPPDMIN